MKMRKGGQMEAVTYTQHQQVRNEVSGGFSGERMTTVLSKFRKLKEKHN